MPKKVDLPFGSQFSPGQVDLPDVLEILMKNDGNRRAAMDEFHQTFFLKKSWEHGRNVYNAARSYGLVDEDSHPTHLGSRLYDMREESDRLYGEFAKHILTSLHGLELLEVVKTLRAQRKKPGLEKIAREFKRRGLHVSQSGMHVSSMRGWLAKAGILTAEGDFDVMPEHDDRLLELLGITEQDAGALRNLNKGQRAYLRAMANLGVDREYDAIKIRDHARTLYKVEYSEKNLRTIIDPLKAAGFITFDPPGRQARTFVRPTAKFRAEVLEPLIESVASRPRMPSRRFLAMPFPDLLAFARRKDGDVTADMQTTRNERGEALEALAVRLAFLLDLSVAGWRLRSSQTGGNEVDLIAEATTPVFARWQIQCKATHSVGNDIVMREAGVAGILQSTAVLIVTTGEIASKARETAEKKMAGDPITILFLDGADLDRISEDETRIIEILERQTERIRDLKSLSEEAIEATRGAP